MSTDDSVEWVDGHHGPYSGGNTHTELEHSSAQWVQANVYHLEDVPAPGEKWTGKDVPYTPQELLKMKNEGVIKRLFNKERDDDYYPYYETDEAGFAAVQTFLKQREMGEGFLPCGHSGFKHVYNGWLECKRCGELCHKNYVD